MNAHRSRKWLAVLVALAMACAPALSDAKKPDKPGGGGGGNDGSGDDGAAPFVFVDLLGVENTSGAVPYYSEAASVSEADVNGNVFVGGYSHLHPAESNHPVLWDVDAGGLFQLTDLGLPIDAVDAFVTDVNGFGDALINSQNGSETAYVKVTGQPLRLLGEDTNVTAINDVGEIVGVYDSGNSSRVGYYWTVDAAGNIVSAIPLGDFQPNDINGNGVMVGEATGRAAMARFINGTLQVQLLSSDLNTTATAISPNGDWVVGEVSTFNGNYWLGEAFVWTEATGLMLLGTLENYGSSYSTGVNDSGQIVGWSDVRGKIGQAAFLFDGGQMQDLNQLVNVGSGLTLRYAYDINNSGHIAGQFLKSSKNNEWRGFLLIPQVQ